MSSICMLVWSLYPIERGCLGTNMADGNRRQGRSHLGKNQEYNRRANHVVLYHVMWYQGKQQYTLGKIFNVIPRYTSAALMN